MKPGFYTDISNDAYHGGPGYSASDIIAMHESFAHWKWKKSQPKEPSREMVMGSVTHLMLEARIKRQPELIGNSIAIYSEGSRLTKGFKTFAEANKTLYTLTPEELEDCHRMIEAVWEEPEAMKLIRGGISEPSIYAYYPGTEVLMKCRPDVLKVERGLSVNFKTMKAVDEGTWVREVGDRGYNWQSGIYLDLLQAHYNRTFDEVHLCVERPTDSSPVRVELYTIPDDDLAFSRTQYEQIIRKIPECERTGIWPKSRAYLKAPSIPTYRQKVVNIA